jgi:hypothetical protein
VFTWKREDVLIIAAFIKYTFVQNQTVTDLLKYEKFNSNVVLGIGLAN